MNCKSKSFLVLVISLFGFSLFQTSNLRAQTQPKNCLPTDMALDFWRPIRESVPDTSTSADELAPMLLDCLGSPNSELRDSIGYELFTYWLRNNTLSATTKTRLPETLSVNLELRSNEDSLRRSFSALILSELLRADNLSPFMSDVERQNVLQRSVDALSVESDYRGLVEGLGWVHPIAHLSDVLWRFALHESLNQDQARLILAGVRSQAGTSNASYVFNESDRLARSVSVLIARGILPKSEVINWLSDFETPTAAETWFDAFASNKGMIELHNSKLFIRALSDQLADAEIDNEVRAKLDELVANFTAAV